MTDREFPKDVHCDCGHLVRRYSLRAESDPRSESDKLEIELGLGPPHIDTRKDVIERECPHHNGTVIEHCPKCDRNTGMWGCGPAGGMDCECWGSCES